MLFTNQFGANCYVYIFDSLLTKIEPIGCDLVCSFDCGDERNTRERAKMFQLNKCLCYDEVHYSFEQALKYTISFFFGTLKFFT